MHRCIAILLCVFFVISCSNKKNDEEKSEDKKLERDNSNITSERNLKYCIVGCGFHCIKEIDNGNLVKSVSGDLNGYIEFGKPLILSFEEKMNSTNSAAASIAKKAANDPIYLLGLAFSTRGGSVQEQESFDSCVSNCPKQCNNK